MNWNGRFGELLRTAFIGALAPTLFFKIANTIVGVVFLLAWFVMLYARFPHSFNDSIILALSILCILVFSAFGSIFVWAAGCLNYLWAYTLVLLVCIPYRLFWDKYNTNNVTPPPPKTITLFLFCIISFCAGMSNEITGVIVVVTHFYFLIYAIFIKKIKLPFWYYAGAFFFLLGFLALYLSPGHAKRAALSAVHGMYYSLGDLWRMNLYEKIVRVNDVLRARGIMLAVFFCFFALFLYEQYKSKRHMHIAIIAFSLFFVIISFAFKIMPHIVSSITFLAILYYIYNVYRKEHKKEVAQIYLYVFLIFAILDIFLLLTLQVTFSGRSGLFIVLIGVLQYILFCKAIVHLFPTLERKIHYGILAFTTLYSIFVLCAFIDTHIKWNNMVEYIEEQKSRGIKDIVVNPKYFHSFYNRYGDWDSPGDNPNTFPNPLYADHFGVSTFVVRN